jgi:putative transcriptional regulator
MNNLKAIRSRLGITQQDLAADVGCTQGNVANYERGQTVPPEMAAKIISVALRRGLTITYDHVYGDVELPAVRPQGEGAHA